MIIHNPLQFCARIWKRIIVAPVDLAQYNGSTPSPAALISEANELLIWMQKNTGFDVQRLFSIMLRVFSGTSRLSAPGVCLPEDWTGISNPVPFSRFDPRARCAGPNGMSELNIFERLAPVYKYWIAEEV